MTGVLIFAGTTEGRRLTDYLGATGVRMHVCVATEYGRSVLKDYGNAEVSVGKLEHGEKCDLMKEYPLVIDATHPYATSVTEHIMQACSDSGARYIRLVRPEGAETEGNVKVFPDIPSAVEYLKEKKGNILVTTGSNDADKYAPIKDRTFVRVLPNAESLAKCAEAGFEGKHVLCMQGPFSEEMNAALIKHVSAEYLVTKDSGQPGGFYEKISACEKTGTEAILIGRPRKEEGMTFDETAAMLSKEFGIEPPRRRISVIGVGMGTPGGLTADAKKAMEEADLIAGAGRMVKLSGSSGTDVLEEYASDKILDYLDKNKKYSDTAVLVSGDVGFYSAARKMIDSAVAAGFDVRVISGISSMVYLCGQLGISWQDVCPISAHGREANPVGAVKTHFRVFSLLQGSEGAKKLCSDLMEFGLENTTVTIGQDLGSSDEKIRTGTPSEMKDAVDSELCVALIENKDFDDTNPIYIPDEEFIRGSPPMTKSEVRAISVAKLKLSPDSVVYDVGAGSGSVSVEMASVAVSGTVYAVEKEPDAVEIIKKNRIKFGVPNLHIVEGYAPEALKDLPAPTHAFIGGSAGNMKQILETILDKNPSVRLTVNAITLETVAETIQCIKELGLIEEDTVCINASKGKTVGKYHLMTAQNPVYVITCRGPGR